MKKISYIFNSTTREQLAEFTRGLMLSIEPEHIMSSNLPLFINIDGDQDSGKSLVWDESKGALLGSSAQINEKRSMDLETQDRIYETWKGSHVNNNQTMSIFFCNISSLYFDMEDVESIRQRLRRNKPGIPDRFKNENLRESFGDLILTSNGKEAGLTKNDLSIFLDSSASTSTTPWTRQTRLTIEKPTLGQSKSFQSFLKAHCEIA